ncbi:hypothetical protein MNBD_BACTEROID02-1899 [hydrothermal vent metagenome]|uniref:DUF4177 domain-containing protein n=1 Tax=hydrothermal vent metagenome TaxID=652676 RepID=A0A3B0QXU6_9ZZZZ
MKEYKVIKPKLGWRNTSEKLQEFLNTHAKQGWCLHSLTTSQMGEYSNIIFEREKNR